MTTEVAAAILDLAALSRPRGRIYAVVWDDDGANVWQYFTRGTDAERQAEAEAFAATIPGARVEAY